MSLEDDDDDDAAAGSVCATSCSAGQGAGPQTRLVPCVSARGRLRCTHVSNE